MDGVAIVNDFGHCYAVVSSCGLCKFGMTKNIVKRIAEVQYHFGAFGKTVDMMMFTPWGEGAKENEKAILREASDRFERVSGEYFKGVTIAGARDLLCNVSDVVLMGSSVKKSSYTGSLIVEVSGVAPDGGSPTESKARKIEARVMSLLEKAEGGMKEGLVINRMRPHKRDDVVGVLRDMSTRGMIAESVEKHPRNGKEATVYSAI